MRPKLRPHNASGHPDIEALARTIRRLAIVSLYHAGSGRPGGALSVSDILAFLYGAELDLWPGRAGDAERDRFILSKGHACAALYAAWTALGIIDQGLLAQSRTLGHALQGDPEARDMTLAETGTGPLGQSFSLAIRVALGLRRKKSRARVYVLLGDGELENGEVWEGAVRAGHHALSNLCVIVDYNKRQSGVINDETVDPEPLADKWRAFRWRVLEIDGHDTDELSQAFSEARREMLRPTVIIAHTIKGKGVRFMENMPAWQGSERLTREDCERALGDLGVAKLELESWIDGTRG
jgi:transketolase